MAPLFKTDPDFRPARQCPKLATRQPRNLVALTVVAVAGLSIGTAFGANFRRVTQQGSPPLTDVKQRAVLPVDEITTTSVPPRLNPSSIDKSFSSAQFGSSAPRIDAGKTVDEANSASKHITVKNKPIQEDTVVPETVFSRPHIVDIAETEADTIDIERRMAALNVEHFILPTRSIASATDNQSPGGLRKGRTIKYVNLRAGPDNDAEVLVIMPANAAILAEGSCIHWCAAVYQGKKGFIYKTLIAYSSGSSSGQSQQQ